MLDSYFKGNPSRGIDRGTYNGKSLVLDGSADYLSRTFGTATDLNVWTFSCWVKRSELGTVQALLGGYSDANNYATVEFDVDDKLRIETVSGGSVDDRIITSGAFRDTNKWYHVVAYHDTDDGTATDRFRIYVDGVRQSISSESSPSSGEACAINGAYTHYIGSRVTTTEVINGYMSKVDFIDGTALTASSFGEISADTDKWVASDTSGLTFGTNGFSLDFNDDRASTPDTTTTIYDQSGNSNNWTGNSLVAGSFTSDTPVDNHATFNPLNSIATLSNGNLTAVCPSTVPRSAASSLWFNSGKWYAEFNIGVATSDRGIVGVVTNSHDGLSDSVTPGATSDNVHYFGLNGEKVVDGTFTTYGDTFTNGDIIGVAVNMDDNEVEFFKNNVSQGVISKTLTGYYRFSAYIGNSTGSFTVTANFGAAGFTYTPPTDFLALSSANLPEPTNWKPQANANIVLYTGDGVAIGSGGNAVTGVGFQPDFSWVKNRDGTNSHQLVDSIRGVTKHLKPDSTGVESTASEGIAQLDSDGFTVGSATGVNTSADDYWSLNILADNTSGSSNTDGSITSTVATDGVNFSIVTYTGTGANATVGHGLASAPDLVIVKNTIDVTDWAVYHSSNTAAPGTDYLEINQTTATQDNVSVWNDTAPTASVFSVGTSSPSNGSGDLMIAYCFVFGDVFAGGSYTGNASTDGTFVPTDELLMFICKETTDVGNWQLLDQVRDTYNVADARVFPDLSNAESQTLDALDFLSNGIKLRANATVNAAETYIWWGIKKNGGSLAA